MRSTFKKSLFVLHAEGTGVGNNGPKQRNLPGILDSDPVVGFLVGKAILVAPRRVTRSFLRAKLEPEAMLSSLPFSVWREALCTFSFWARVLHNVPACLTQGFIAPRAGWGLYTSGDQVNTASPYPSSCSSSGLGPLFGRSI